MPVPALLTSLLNSILGEAVNAAMEDALKPAPLNQEVATARPFPGGTAKGELSPIANLSEGLLISGNSYRRAPGLQIRNQQNMIVMPMTVQEKVPVRFQLDASGAVFRVWLLTRAEAAVEKLPEGIPVPKLPDGGTAEKLPDGTPMPKQPVDTKPSEGFAASQP